jgi:peptidyl-prolyl cis-trans isomerase A (cyclophilin A)
MAATSQRKRSNPTPKQSSFMKNKSILLIGLVVVVLIVIAGIWIVFGSSNDGETPVQGNPIAVFDTSKGTFKVELFQDTMPITANNFIRLVQDGFYDGMLFYRIMDDFMIQAGRVMQDGTEKTSPYGNIDFEDNPDVTHVDGAISMASTGAGVGGAAEFFICDGAQAFLDGNYAAFGVVIEGIEVVRDIADDPHDNSNPAGGGVPNQDIIINKITLENI